MTCPNCQRNVHDSEVSCTTCHFPLKKRCKFCGSNNELSDARCKICGKSLPELDKEITEPIIRRYRKSLWGEKYFSIPSFCGALVSLIAIPGSLFWLSHFVYIAFVLGLIGVIFGTIGWRGYLAKGGFFLGLLSILGAIIVVIVNREVLFA